MALSRVCSIIHLAVCLLLQWLAGNYHKLTRYDWSIHSIGQCIDMLENALEQIVDDGSYILDEDFIMGIFTTLHKQLPPFLAYFTHMFENKKMIVTADKHKNVVHSEQLRNDLFLHESEPNEEISEMTIKLESIASSTLLLELRDDKKANV